MTTSTDNAPSKEKSKPLKRPGPVRTGAVVPIIVILLASGLYANLFLDHHLKLALEYVGTQVNGAEVNIQRLSTSFWRANLEIDQIQITDKEKPQRNVIQVGSIRFKMLWDALLRAKVVVDEASVLNIQALTPRKTPGYVVPPEPPNPDSGPSLVANVQDRVLKQTRKTWNENFLGDVAAVLGGVDPKDQLKNIQAELKSDSRIKELEKELKEKSAKWKQRIDELPQSHELKAYETRVKALKFDTKNPAELAKNLKEAEKIFKEVDQKVKLIEQTSKDVKGDVNVYKQAYTDLEKMIQDDVKDLQKRLKIPEINGKDFSQQLFMSMIEEKIVGFQKYAEIAKKYMPPKRSEEEKQAKKEEQLVPTARGAGKTYRFKVTTGYPLFWLKKAALSSELGQSELSGNLAGEILDLTTDPVAVGKPTLVTLKGDFPKVEVFGLDAKITLDHTREIARQTADVKIASFPLSEQKLANSSDVKLVMSGAKGQSNLNASLIDQTLSLDMQNRFTDVKFDVQAKSKVVKEMMSAILNGIPNVNLSANVKGSLSDFDINVRSNLGDELAAGFKKQVQAKLAEAQAKLKQFIDEKIGKEKDKLKAEMDKVTGSLTKNLDDKKAEVDKAKADAKSATESGKGQSPNKKIEAEGKKLFKKLLGR